MSAPTLNRLASLLLSELAAGDLYSARVLLRAYAAAWYCKARLDI